MDMNKTPDAKVTDAAAPQSGPGSMHSLGILKLSLPKKKSFQHIPVYDFYHHQEQQENPISI